MNTVEKAKRIIASNQGGYPQEVAQAYLDKCNEFERMENSWRREVNRITQNHLDQQWIPVSERPKKKGRYWVWSTKYGDYEGYWGGSAWLFDDSTHDDNVTHYKPLPPPPEDK